MAILKKTYKISQKFVQKWKYLLDRFAIPIWDPFWELLGSLWGALGRHFGKKGGPERDRKNDAKNGSGGKSGNDPVRSGNDPVRPYKQSFLEPRGLQGSLDC